MDLYGATRDDFARVKVKNSRHGLENENARYRKANEIADVLNSPLVADPLVAARHLRHERRRRGDDHHVGRVRRAPTGSPTPCACARSPRSRRPIRTPSSRCRTSPPTPRQGSPPPAPAPVQGLDRDCRVRGGRHRPRRPLRARRCTTCRPRSSSTGTSTSACASEVAPRRCCASGATTLGGRIPVNPSGGLACFGEAVPAQAIAQVCELTWQLRGQREGPPGRRARRWVCRSTRACSVTAPA